MITLIIFLFLGLNIKSNINPNNIEMILSSIESKFLISPLLFLVPISVVIVIVKNVPAIPAFFIGTLLGGIVAIIFQNDIINELGAGNNFFHSCFV